MMNPLPSFDNDDEEEEDDIQIPHLDEAIAMNRPLTDPRPGSRRATPTQLPRLRLDTPLTARNDSVTAAQLEQWHENERRQRTLRVLLMFLLMLLVMDGDHDTAAPSRESTHRLRRRNPKAGGRSQLAALRPTTRVFDARQAQDQRIRSLIQRHRRYQSLVQKNGQVHVEKEIVQWAEKELTRQLEARRQGLSKDEFAEGLPLAASEPVESLPKQRKHAEDLRVDYDNSLPQTMDPLQDARKVYHYPWNATGFYRGQWVRIPTNDTILGANPSVAIDSVWRLADRPAGPASLWEAIDAPTLEPDLQHLLRARNQRHKDPTPVGVVLLPQGKHIRMRDDHNFTSLRYEQVTVDASGRTYPPRPLAEASMAPTESGLPYLTDPTSLASLTPPTRSRSHNNQSSITLTRNSGRVAFQLFSRKLPTLRELSLVDGFVKLYDSDHSQGYSTRQDVLLRVRGVLVHGIGRLSLVANADVTRSALVMDLEGDHQVSSLGTVDGTAATERMTQSQAEGTRRRLMEDLTNWDAADKAQVRRNAQRLYQHDTQSQPVTTARPLSWRTLIHRRLQETAMTSDSRNTDLQRLSLEDSTIAQSSNASSSRNQTDLPPWSDVVIPFPYTMDDEQETIRKSRTAAARRMPAREQLLEDNAEQCEFEISMDVQDVEWTVGAWRNLMFRKLKEVHLLNPRVSIENELEEELSSGSKWRSKAHLSRLSPRERAKLLQDQAVVMIMTGKIESPNCNFSAYLNATAIRTDWDATTSKAINYSFYMMLVCLGQILILLRQLLYSQSQSAATKVSVLCIGWQTVIDALVCLAHIYLSLAMQPLFAAFASVAFFKLLIFCVIEMKYMAMIMQARNNSSGGNQTQEALRRQVTVLHVRFYVTLFAAFLLAFYVGDKYRTMYALLLYSFWVPQIVLNVITETKRPMHKYYIYGMSVSRLVAPLYIFCLPNNFLKEVYPDSPTDPVMCELLILWVAIQTAVLLAQGKYGARFMIPARCLPPKFDYSRPLPASMLPPSGLESPRPEIIDDDHRGTTHSPLGKDEMVSASEDLPARSRHATAPTTRNRTRGTRRLDSSATSSMVTERLVTKRNPAAPQFTLDCSICYEAIDVSNPRGYMLAPCNHLFHRDCLIQWMDIKMECPICRTNLPAL